MATNSSPLRLWRCLRECVREDGNSDQQGGELANEFEFAACCGLVSNITQRHLKDFHLAAATDFRLAQPVTPETVNSPTQAGRPSRLRNFIMLNPQPPARLSNDIPLDQPGKHKS